MAKHMGVTVFFLRDGQRRAAVWSEPDYAASASEQTPEHRQKPRKSSRIGIIRDAGIMPKTCHPRSLSHLLPASVRLSGRGPRRG